MSELKGSLHKHERRDFTWHANKCDELKELLEDILISARAGYPVNHEMRHRWNQSWTGTVIGHIMKYAPQIIGINNMIKELKKQKNEEESK